MFIVGIAAVCVGHNEANQTLLYVGVTFTTIAFQEKRTSHAFSVKNKTRLKMREDTELKNFPLFCPKCKNETLIDVRNLHITVIKKPDAQTQSR